MSPEKVNDETWLTYDEASVRSGYSTTAIRKMANNDGRYRDLSDYKRKLGRSAFVEESMLDELENGSK